MPTYPITKTVEQVDDHHGVSIADPYRWLENLDSEDTRAWIAEQNAVTFDYLSRIPFRDQLRARLTELWDFEKFGPPSKHGDRYFFLHNDGLQNQYVLKVLDSIDGEPRVLLDPNAWSDDGTVALIGAAATEDGRLMAFGQSSSGSDWTDWRVIDVDTGTILGDHLKWAKFSRASWTADRKGFFYSRYDEPDDFKLEDTNYFQKLYYHRLGTPQSEDELIYERADVKELGFDPSVTEDGRYLVITVWRGTDPKNMVFYKDLVEPGAPVVELIDEFYAHVSFVGSDERVLYFQTDLDAPRHRLIAIDLRSPARADWRELIPQASETLESISFVGGRFFACYLKDARSAVRVFDADGTFAREVALPGIGTAAGFGGRARDRETFYLFTGHTNPTTIYRYDIASGRSTVFRAPKVDFDPGAFETRQVFFASKDGTKIPMFLTHRTGLALDGSHPTFLYGYGGFNVSQSPAFGISPIVWMEYGGVYAVACVRGGGEYGEEWHQAGCKANKQNVFDDFIAAGEWLIENGYTAREKLCISGGSNGGLLVGACITQRPDLFGAARIDVGVLDMLRFHRYTIGWAWTSDYGSAEDAEEFRHLLAYSPLHNIKPETRYPPTLVTTADHDDRVVPSHSFKFISALQAAQAGDAPVLIRVDVKAGHGMGKPTQKIIDELADVQAFLLHNLGIREL